MQHGRWMRIAASILLMAMLLATQTGTVLSAAPEVGAARSPDSPMPGFVENVGQFRPEVRFQLQRAGSTLWVTDDALWVTLVESARPDDKAGTDSALRTVTLRLSFPGASSNVQIKPLQHAPGKINYYRGTPGSWYTQVSSWQALRLEGLYPGVDLELDSRGKELTWRFVSKLQGAAGSEKLALRVEGADAVAVEGNNLRITTPLGDVSLPLPDATAAIGAIGGSNDTVVSLHLNDAFSPDPTAATTTASGSLFSTYLGGTNDDYGAGIAVGSDGSIYVTGMTLSTDFPRTTGPGTLNGSADVFVTRLAANGTSLIYSTYLGGSYNHATYYDNECGNAVAVDSGGNAYITGYTQSSDFPTTAGAFDRTFNGPTGSRAYADAFITKLSPTGAVLYSTYVGGSGYFLSGSRRGDDVGASIALHNGRVYVTGGTASDDFPTTSGAFDRTYANPPLGMLPDAFLVVLNPAGGGTADLIYSTYIGGADTATAYDLAVDSAGSAYLTGSVDSFHDGDFPTTTGAYDRQVTNDNTDAFVVKLTPQGNGASDLLYSTVLGWDQTEAGHGIGVDSAGTIYVSGTTNDSLFPTTANAYDRTYNGGYDIFLAKVDPTKTGTAGLLYGTFLGGSLAEGDYSSTDPGDLALTPGGDVILTGYTRSSNFPVTADAQWTFRRGEADAFVTRLQPQSQGAADLIYSTYLGGDGSDYGQDITAIDNQTAYVTGYTYMSYNFPTTPGACDTTLSGDTDAFVAHLAAPQRPDLSTSSKSVTPEQANAGEVVTFTVRLINSGYLTGTVAVTDTLPATLKPQGSPTSSAGTPPVINGQILTWGGTIAPQGIVTLTYTTLLTSTTNPTPIAMNLVKIGDGYGNLYTRQATVNYSKLFLPLTLRNS